MLSIKNLLRALVLLLVLSVVWHYRGAILDMFSTDNFPRKPIVFDNGTVRQYAPALEPDATVSQSTIPDGVMRRCTLGSKVSYSNSACPLRYKEKAMSTDKFNVISSK